MIESAARRLAHELVNRREAINRELSRNGVRFGIYKNGEYHDRLFPYDPVPRIIESDEFDELEKGLKQRVNALNAYLKDIYSDKAIIHDGVVPEEYVYTYVGYFPQVNGVTPPGGIFAHIAGEDLVQGEDGRWWVLEDNLRIPSGASYPLFVRDIERRISPRLFRDVRIRDNREYPRLLRKAMDFVSTEGIAVVLTPGRYNSAFFEHAYLAEKTGAALAFPEDLEVVDNKVYFLDYAGKRHRVGVVYRRLSDEFLDPFSFNPDSVIGVPGLLSAYRAGNVAIVNAPGNGAADDKAIYYFVPQMIKYYLGEEPILHNAPTYMPMFEADRKEVLNRMGELVIKDVAEAEDIYNQRDITDDMLAFWGGIENSPVDPTLKAFIFIGKYLERIDLYTRFGLTMEEMEAPLKKLASYSMILDGMPLPSCFADGLSWLVGQLPSRGYQEMADSLKKYLDDYSGRVSALAIKDMGSLSSMNMDAKRP